MSDFNIIWGLIKMNFFFVNKIFVYKNEINYCESQTFEKL